MAEEKSKKEAKPRLAESIDEEDSSVSGLLSNESGENQYSYSLKIPIERVAALIGTGGATKNQIETETGCKLNIDSKEGEVEISSNDSIKLYTAREIIKAIGRGFNPTIALSLLKPDYVFDIIELRQIMKSIAQMQRLKGRVIGEGGKARSTIEGLTDTSISVYGKTISIIGEASNVATAKRAVESLLSGSNHSSVYNWLEKHRRMAKADEFRREFRIKDEGEETIPDSDEFEGKNE